MLSKITYFYNDFNKQPKKGTIRVKKWGNKLADIDYHNIKKVVIKPVNNTGKAMITMVKFLKKQKANKNVKMTIENIKVTATYENMASKNSYSVKTNQPNKIVKESVKKN